MASKERTPDQLRADIAASRHAMTVGIEGLVSQVHPTAIKNQAEDEVKQTVTDAKQAIYDSVDGTRRYFVDDDGVQWNNLGTIALIAAGVAAVVGVAAGISALFGKVTR